MLVVDALDVYYGRAHALQGVSFTIASGGRVRAASIETTTVDDTAVQACVMATVKSWTFPTIVAAAGDVAVRYPFSVG